MNRAGNPTIDKLVHCLHTVKRPDQNKTPVSFCSYFSQETWIREKTPTEF